jgi:polyferredoxin
MLWSLLIPVSITVLLGRVFCGWICPMNTLLEVIDKCRRLLRIAEIRDVISSFRSRTSTDFGRGLVWSV